MLYKPIDRFEIQFDGNGTCNGISVYIANRYSEEDINTGYKNFLKKNVSKGYYHNNTDAYQDIRRKGKQICYLLDFSPYKFLDFTTVCVEIDWSFSKKTHAKNYILDFINDTKPTLINFSDNRPKFYTSESKLHWSNILRVEFSNVNIHKFLSMLCMILESNAGKKLNADIMFDTRSLKMNPLIKDYLDEKSKYIGVR